MTQFKRFNFLSQKPKLERAPMILKSSGVHLLYGSTCLFQFHIAFLMYSILIFLELHLKIKNTPSVPKKPSQLSRYGGI
jgi:hypothetical protein